MVLDWCQNFVSTPDVWNKLMEFDQILHMHLYWEDLKDGFITNIHKYILQIYNRDMTLDWCQNFISTQYLEHH